MVSSISPLFPVILVMLFWCWLSCNLYSRAAVLTFLIMEVFSFPFLIDFWSSCYLLIYKTHHWIINTFNHEWHNRASADCDRSREGEKKNVWFPHSCREEQWGMHQLQTMALYPCQWHINTHSLSKHIVAWMHISPQTDTHTHTQTLELLYFHSLHGEQKILLGSV